MWPPSYGCFSTGMRDDRVIMLIDWHCMATQGHAAYCLQL